MTNYCSAENKNKNEEEKSEFIVSISWYHFRYSIIIINNKMNMRHEVVSKHGFDCKLPIWYQREAKRATKNPLKRLKLANEKSNKIY